MIKLNQLDKGPIYINPLHIVSINDSLLGGSVVVVVTSSSYIVTEPPKVINQLITNSKNTITFTI